MTASPSDPADPLRGASERAPPRSRTTSSPAEGTTQAPTVPEASGATVRERADAMSALLADLVDDARSAIAPWDHLARVRAFAAGAARVRGALPTTTHPLERRALARSLLRLLPPVLLPLQPAGRDLAFCDDVARRADDDFAFRDGDAPRVHPSWSAFLARKDIVDGALRPGRHERLLAPRSLSPGADPTGSTGSTAVLVSVDHVTAAGDAALLTVFGARGPSTRRLTSDGRDAGEATLRLDALSSWLLAAGPGARGLDLRRADDRALLLCFLSTLRARRLDRLLLGNVDDIADPALPERRADVIEAVVDAAADTVAFATLDPLACRLCLPDTDWGREAGKILDDTGIVAEITPRVPAQGLVRELVWLDAVADPGFIGGAMSAVAQARAFARLAVSLLAPLGALPNTGARDGSGVVVTVLFEDEMGGRARGPFWIEPASPEVRLPLADAWALGRGRFLAEPRASTAHDVQALPGWLRAFLDALEDVAPCPEP